MTDRRAPWAGLCAPFILLPWVRGLRVFLRPSRGSVGSDSDARCLPGSALTARVALEGVQGLRKPLQKPYSLVHQDRRDGLCGVSLSVGLCRFFASGFIHPRFRCPAVSGSGVSPIAGAKHSSVGGVRGGGEPPCIGLVTPIACTATGGPWE